MDIATLTTLCKLLFDGLAVVIMIILFLRNNKKRQEEYDQERKEYQEMPPKVEYYLSDKGKSLMPILDQLCDWGEKNRQV